MEALEEKRHRRDFKRELDLRCCAMDVTPKKTPAKKYGKPLELRKGKEQMSHRAYRKHDLFDFYPLRTIRE